MHGRHTFPKQDRLQRAADFRHVYDQGRRCAGKLIVLYALATPGKRGTVGVVTSRKVGSAVVRNRARRLMREAYRLNKHKLKPNFQIVMIARTAIQGQRFASVEAEMLRLSGVAGILVES